MGPRKEPASGGGRDKQSSSLRSPMVRATGATDRWSRI